MVGQEDVALAGLRIDVDDAAQRLGVIAPRGRHGQDHGLIADQARGLVHRARGDAPQAWVLLLARVTKKAWRCLMPPEPGEVQVAAIDDVDRAGLGADLVHQVHVVHAAVGNDHESGDIAAQIQQRVQLDAGLGLCESAAQGNSARHRSMVVESRA